MSEVFDALLSLEGVGDAAQTAREACTQLRWHAALRRRIPEAAAESRVRGARATALLEGVEVDHITVRDLLRGALEWPPEPDPWELTLRGAVQVTAATEASTGAVLLQDLVRLQIAAAAPISDADELGRPRADGETCDEFATLGQAPSAAEALDRLRSVLALLDASNVPAPVAGALLHAEIAVARPFTRGNGLVARAAHRGYLRTSGLDPTGVAVIEAGYAAKGSADYLGALTAYAQGGTDGVRLWLIHSADAVVAAAAEGSRICDAVLAGRLS